MNNRIPSTSILNILPQMTYNGIDCVNIFKSYEIVEAYKKSISYYSIYEVQDGDRWEVLANKFYLNRYLWWVIAIFNGIIDPFSELAVGTQLKIIKSQFISEIIYAIRKAKEENS